MIEASHQSRQLPQVLYKYTPHRDFLGNGLFLFSPPGTNDPKEALPEVIFQRYTPEDYAVARSKAQQAGLYNISVEMLEQLFLNPYPAHRRDEKNYPALWRAGMLLPELRTEPF